MMMRRGSGCSCDHEYRVILCGDLQCSHLSAATLERRPHVVHTASLMLGRKNCNSDAASNALFTSAAERSVTSNPAANPPLSSLSIAIHSSTLPLSERI